MNEQGYLDLVQDVIDHGHYKPVERTGVGTWSRFGKSLRFDLRDNRLPMLTTKKMFFKGIAKELLWFLKGDCTTTDMLVKDNVHIWDLNSTRDYLDSRGLQDYTEGELGPIYGYQWRHWGKKYKGQDKIVQDKIVQDKNVQDKKVQDKIVQDKNVQDKNVQNEGIDQIQKIIETIRTNPNDRRMILSAWNVSDLDQMALPPCHVFAQFYVREVSDKKYLSCAMYQRSADLFLGVPFNVTSYALLTHLIAHVTDCEPEELVMFFGDAHVYANHLEAVKTQLARKDQCYDFPTLRISDTTKDIDQIQYTDLMVENYESHGTISAPMAV
jgi:thymidylate synthase